MSVSKPFCEDFSAFLQSAGIEFSKENHLTFQIMSQNSVIRLVEAGFNQVNSLTEESVIIKSCITIYEDEWATKRKIIINRLLAIFGRGKTVFARNCSVREISTEQAKMFLDENHMLGYARSRYKYGLCTKKTEGDLSPDTLVCVATFSEPRIMIRGGVPVESFEWVRYASLDALRVNGGMGKLMSHFIKQIRPAEIMSYADIDWSTGFSYEKLGFKLLERTKPIEFFVERSLMKRYTRQQLARYARQQSIRNGKLKQKNQKKEELSAEDADKLIDTGRNNISIDTSKYYILRNQGNLKFIWSSAL